MDPVATAPGSDIEYLPKLPQHSFLEIESALVILRLWKRRQMVFCTVPVEYGPTGRRSSNGKGGFAFGRERCRSSNLLDREHLNFVLHIKGVTAPKR